MSEIDKSIARYLSQLESADRQEAAGGPPVPESKVARLTEKVEILHREIKRLKMLEAEMLATQDIQISLTDPDARSMATSGRDTGIVGYNVQSAVDNEHHLIVACEEAGITVYIPKVRVPRRTGALASRISSITLRKLFMSAQPANA